MSRKSQRIVWASLLVLSSALVFSAPSVGRACDCRRQATAVAYAPAVTAAPAVAVRSVGYAAAPVCSTCAAATAYMPVTAYRAFYRPVAVTALMTYQPATSVAYSTQLVPYASYTPVVSYSPVVSVPVTATALPVAMPAATCSSCSAATTTYRVGDSYSVVSSTVTPSCPTMTCGTTVTAQMPIIAPVLPASTTSPLAAPTPAPAAAPTPAPPVTPATPAPAAESGAPSTYRPGTTPAPGIAPVPGSGTNTKATPDTTLPTKQQPTVMPASQSVVHQAAYHAPVAPTLPAAAATLRDDGWGGVGD